MYRNICALHAIASKQSRNIVGLMSGTSLDGLDVALCRLLGSGKATRASVTHFATVQYSDDVKGEIRAVFARKSVDFIHLTVLNAWIGSLHAAMVLKCLDEWGVLPSEVDLIASHGQTVLHAPRTQHRRAKFPNATLQIGDGDHIAVKTGIITVSDFRQKHLAAGGEGAPLAVYGDLYIFGKRGRNRIMVNIGGIANFTYLPSTLDPQEVFVTDTGTGNTLIDAVVQRNFPGQAFDAGAELANRGRVNARLLSKLKDDEFFTQALPKTTGPEHFDMEYVAHCQAASATSDLSVFDLLATLTRFSAETIAEAVHACMRGSRQPVETFEIYLSGGGMHNPLLVEWLRELLPCPIGRTDDLGICGDAKEALLFAVLANETVSGESLSFGARTGIPSISMGKISFPS